MRKDERELQLVADGLSVAAAGAELRQRRGSLRGAKGGSEGGTSDHVCRMKMCWWRREKVECVVDDGEQRAGKIQPRLSGER